MSKAIIYSENYFPKYDMEFLAKSFFPKSQIIPFKQLEDKSFSKNRIALLEKIFEEKPNVVVISNIEFINQINLAKKIRERKYEGGLIFGFGFYETESKIIINEIPNLRKNHFLYKPFSSDDYRKILKKYLK